VVDLEYDGCKSSSFAEYFNKGGYVTILLCSPYRDPLSLGSGVGIYFMEERFKIIRRDHLGFNLRIDVGGSGDVRCLDMLETRSNVLLNIEERRSLGYCKLWDYENQEIIHVIAIHLMTSSKDQDGTVRKHEILFLKDFVAGLEGGKVIIGGDFNCDYKSGIFEECGYINGGFICGGRKIYNVHSDVVGGVTSRTNRRAEDIDYIFTDMEVRERSEKRVEEVIPNEKEGSDHIPVWAVLE